MSRPEGKKLLSVCVIGRNEALNLSLLMESLCELRKHFQDRLETIYVDSASTDNTVEVARPFFDKIYVIEDSENICAAAGRYIGTLKAAGDYVLYLDGDMELCKEFIEIIKVMMSKSGDSVGYVGNYIYQYPSGERRVLELGGNRKWKKEAEAEFFGGAVLLPRKIVLQVGNWNPGVFSYEENDLYARLKKAGCPVRFVYIPMIRHNTKRLSYLKTILYCFIPSVGGFGKKYFGFGQVLSSRYKKGTLLNFIRYFPLPFIYNFSMLLSIGMAMLGFYWIGMAMVFISVIMIWTRKGYKYLVIYLGYMPQAILGWSKYNANYIPKIEHMIVNNSVTWNQGS